MYTAELVGHYRLPKEAWVPLMEEARNESLLTREISPLEVAYLVREVSPYTLRHLMIVPDTKNPKASSIGSIISLSAKGLGGFLQFNADVAREFLADSEIQELDMGFNFTEEDSPIRRKLASVPDHLHSHVVGYSKEELARVITEQQARGHPEWRAGMHDPLLSTSLEIFEHEVVPYLENRFPSFEELFVKEPGRKELTFRFIPGLDGFSHPDLGDILRLMHQRGKEVYREVTGCFCKSDPKTGKFLETIGGRYELLAKKDRVLMVDDFVNKRKWISPTSQRLLRFLATSLKHEDEVIEAAMERFGKQIERLPTEDETKMLVKETADRQWLMKGFTYTMVWSSKGEDWFFGFDPRILSASGITPSSRTGTPKVFWRSGQLLSKDEQATAEKFEESLVKRLKVFSSQKG